MDHTGTLPPGRGMVGDMSARRPTLLISNIVPRHEADPLYEAFSAMLWDSLTRASTPHWNVIREWAQLDGPEGAVSRARHADAILIMGGDDVDPRWYGGTPDYPHEGTHWPRADAGQMALVRLAVEENIPLLGICRGMQVINVAMGGTLVQDMNQPGHRSATLMQDHHFARHGVDIDPSSHLATALGELADLEVHSAHHQCVEQVGDDLEVVAHAPDGVIEAVEHRSAPVIGVQWHPEDPEADHRALDALLTHLDETRALQATPRLAHSAA